MPLPSATNNHQYYNAKYLSNRKAAILIEEKNLSNQQTSNIIKDIIFNRDLLEEMLANLNKIVEIDSNNLMYKQIFCE